MDKTPTVRRNLWLTHDLNLRIEDAARAMGLRPNAWIIVAVNAYLAPRLTTPAPPAIHLTMPPAPQPRAIFKVRKSKERGYVPPDFDPADDPDFIRPPGARPLPWAIVLRVGKWLEQQDSPFDLRPVDIANALKLTQADATMGHFAFTSEFYANQLDLIQAVGSATP